MVNKQLQYKYCSISHEIKETGNEICSGNRISQKKIFS